MLGHFWRGRKLWGSWKSVSPSLGWKSVLSCGLLLFGSAHPPHTTVTELKKQTLWCGGILFAKLNWITLDILKGRNSLWAMWAATSFFFSFTGALVCVVLGGRGVEQTKQKQTDFPPQWCHCRKLKKQRLYGLDFLGSGGGGHQESLPTWPPTSEIKEAKMGTKRTEKKTILYGSTKIKLIPTSMEDKLLREEAKKEREQKWYLLGLFFSFFFCTGVLKKIQQKSLWWCYFFICLVLCLPRLSNCDSESVCRTSVYCCSFKCLLVLFPF